MRIPSLHFTNPFFRIYPNHDLYKAVPVIVLGLLLGSLNITNPAEKRRENEFLLLNIKYHHHSKSCAYLPAGFA